jgi:hypothetical protein
MHPTHKPKGHTMRKATALSLLVTVLLSGCSQASTSSTGQPAKSVQVSQAASTTPSQAKAMPSEPKESLPPEPTETFHFQTIDPKKEELANDDITVICDIVTHEVHTHEFPELWLEGSRESKLAEEYERLLPGLQAHDALMRDCPAYAELHSKNAG